MKINIKKGYLFAICFCLVAAALLFVKYYIVPRRGLESINYKSAFIRLLSLLLILAVPSLLLARFYYKWKDRNPIIRYAKNKHGTNIDGAVIDFAEVFNFQWQTAYIFSGQINREYVSAAIGFEYLEKIDRDNHNLLLFVENNTIVQKYFFFDNIFLFSDDNKGGVYKIVCDNARYRIKNLANGTYRLEKLTA